MKRRSVITAAEFRTAAATQLETAAAPGPDIVRQSELHQLVDLFDRVMDEVCTKCVDIRRRLETGALLERGELGVSTMLGDDIETLAEPPGMGGLFAVEIDSAEELLQQAARYKRNCKNVSINWPQPQPGSRFVRLESKPDPMDGFVLA